MVVGEFTQETELVVIGGGPAGYAAAFRAAHLGISTVIVDPRPTLGGICLHAGCVPSKTLLAVSEAITTATDAARFGVSFGEPNIDPDAIRGWVDQTVNTLGRGLASRAKSLGVEHLVGEARFEDGKHLAIPGGSVPRVKFRRAIIATGSRPVGHPVLPFDDDRIWRPGHAIRLPKVPESMLIVGSAYMAVELAGIYAALGTRVTVVDAGPRLVPLADDDLARPLLRRLGKRIEAVRLDTTIADATIDDRGVHVTFACGPATETGVFERVVIAGERLPRTDGLGLEHTRAIRGDDGFIVVDDEMKTEDPRIFAVGDVTNSPMLADVALVQGRVAGENAAGWASVYDSRAIPMVVFTDPQIAWCGLMEAEAKADGIPHAVSRVPWGASGRAVGMGRPEGVTKLVYDPDTKIVLGVGLAGPMAAEMIAEGALAVEMGAELDDLAGTMHPHPTMSEMLCEAAQQAT